MVAPRGAIQPSLALHCSRVPSSVYEARNYMKANQWKQGISNIETLVGGYGPRIMEELFER